MRFSIWDVFSILAVILMIVVGIVVLVIFTNPYSTLNPFPPATPPSLIELPTATPTYRSLPATWTPDNGTSGVIAETLRPSSTLMPTGTGFRLNTPTNTPTLTPTVTNTRTATRTATETLVPTFTLQPTYTLIPTNTVEVFTPTDTLVP